MAFGEYLGILSFGIISTGALAYNPSSLPLFVIGGVAFSLMFVQFINWSYDQISKSKIDFIILSIIAGLVAFIGILISNQQGIIVKINGSLWILMALFIMKINLDDIFK